MSNDLRTQIFNNLKLRETDELLSIWQTNDRVEWTDTAFEVIRELLQERLGEIPPQNEPITKHVDPLPLQNEPGYGFSVNKPLRITNILLGVLVFGFLSVLIFIGESLVRNQNNATLFSLFFCYSLVFLVLSMGILIPATPGS